MSQKRVLFGILLLAFAGCGQREASPTAGQGSSSIPASAPQPSGPAAESPQVAAQPKKQAAGSRPDAKAADSPSGISQDQDQPFDVNQFLASRSIPKDNAVAAYISAMEQSRALGDFGNPDYLKKVRSGEIPQQKVEEVLKSAAGLLRQIDLAQQKPSCPFVTNISVDALPSYADSARQVAGLSWLQMCVASAKGDAESAAAAIRRGLRLSRDLRPLGRIACQGVSLALDLLISDGIMRFILDSPKLTTDQCDQVLSLLAEHEQQGLNRCQEAARVEYIVARRTIDDLEAGGNKAEMVRQHIQGKLAKATGKRVQISIATGNFADERAACSRVFAAALRDAEAPYHQVAAASEVRAEMASLTQQAKTPQGTQMRLTLLLVPATNTLWERATMGEVCLTGTALLTAVRRFELSHGRVPESLDGAVSETILKTVPTDPYSGRPMRYAVIGGKPTVYSIGKDLKDDGGLKDWEGGKQPGDCLFALTPLPKPRPAPASDASTSSPEARSTPGVEVTPAPAVRTWTSTVGTTVEAEFVGLEGDIALLRKGDGTVLRVPLGKLSAQDREWIGKVKK